MSGQSLKCTRKQFAERARAADAAAAERLWPPRSASSPFFAPKRRRCRPQLPPRTPPVSRKENVFQVEEGCLRARMLLPPSREGRPSSSALLWCPSDHHHQAGLPSPSLHPARFLSLACSFIHRTSTSPTGRGVWFPFFLTTFYCQLRATVIGARVNKLHLCRSVLEQRAVLGTSLPFRLSRPRSVADHPSSCRLLQLQSCAIYRKDYPQD